MIVGIICILVALVIIYCMCKVLGNFGTRYKRGEARIYAEEYDKYQQEKNNKK